MSIKSTGDSTVPPIKTLLTNPQDGEALTYNAATGTFINGIPFTTVKPVLTSPSNASNLEALTNYTFQTSTSFSITPANYLLTHYATDWQIAGDAAFSTVLTQSTLDTSNKTSWTAQFVAGYPQVYVRLRFHNGQEYSAYSDTVIYNVTQVYNFTSTQNFTVPAGVNAIQVNLLGGGGGSGSSNAEGGGGGGVSQQNSLAVTPSTEYLVTVGAGSTGGNAAGSSSFGNLLSVNGGSGSTSGNGYTKGTANVAPGGAGGAGGKGGDGGGFNWEGIGARYGGSGGPGVTLSIDSTTRGGGGGAGVTGGGNTNMGYGGIGQHGGGNGYQGASHGWFGVGNNGTNTYGGGAGGSNQGTSTGGNGVVRIKF
jgi:hypothetical protein